VACFLIMMGMANASDYEPDDCIECRRRGSEESDLTISIRDYEGSVHGGENTCMDCHSEVLDEDHQTTEGSGMVDCSGCHDQENQHGMGGAEDNRPQCHSCHTRHNMRPKTDPTSSVHPDRLSTTCATCHAATTGETDYFSWFPAFKIASHAKGDFAGDYSDDNCLGCHQGAAAHGEEDPLVDQDCHKCHLTPGAEGAMWGPFHAQADPDRQPAVYAAASIYQGSIFVGLILIIVAIVRKRAQSPRKKPARRIPRI
jgi:hypothetical protein